jgi:hypothetical protein
MVSIARSGDSPESVGALAFMLKTQPQIRHLVITCNAAGSLARTYQHDPRVAVEETNVEPPLPEARGFSRLPPASIAGRSALGQDTLHEGSIRALRQGQSNKNEALYPLPERSGFTATKDKGLVMTSSFTSLVLAARFLGLVAQPARYRSICEQLSQIASQLIYEHLGTFAEVAKATFQGCLSG